MIDASFDAPKRLLQFASFFRQCFTKRAYASFVLYLCGMLLEHRRLSIQSVAAKTPLSVYGRLQYFISECKWSTDSARRSDLSQNRSPWRSRQPRVRLWLRRSWLCWESEHDSGFLANCILITRPPQSLFELHFR